MSTAEKSGVKAAIREREALFGDDCMAPKSEQPDPSHVIHMTRKG